MKIIKCVYVCALCLSLLCGCSVQSSGTQIKAIEDFLFFEIPEEFEDPLTMKPKYEDYFNTIYDPIEFCAFDLIIVTTNDKRVNLFCVTQKDNHKFVCDGYGSIFYDFPIGGKVEDRFTDFLQDNGDWYIYGLHAKIDTPVYINGIAATTTDYTVELGGQTQELQFSYAVLDESAIDEGVDITY